MEGLPGTTEPKKGHNEAVYNARKIAERDTKGKRRATSDGRAGRQVDSYAMIDYWIASISSPPKIDEYTTEYHP
jgi:hypothetical protein